MFYNTDTPRLSFTIVLSIHSSLRLTRPGAGVRSRINFQGIFGILWNTGGASVPLQCFTLLVSLWPSPPFGYAGFQFNFERPWWWMWTVMRKMIHPSKYEAIKTSEKEKVSLHFSSKANVKGKLNKKGGVPTWFASFIIFDFLPKISLLNILTFFAHLFHTQYEHATLQDFQIEQKFLKWWWSDLLNLVGC